jgi:Ala-tRNA(Pro) deacylase
MKCQARLEEYLRQNTVPYDVEQHRTAFTAQELAQAEHIPGKTVAKVVVARADGNMTMFVLPATYMLEYARAAEVTGSREVSLCGEGELAAAFPDCEVGAMPPFGNLYGLPVYVDRHLAEDESIVFAAGTHATTIRMLYADYQRLVTPRVEEIGRSRAVYAS